MAADNTFTCTEVAKQKRMEASSRLEHKIPMGSIKSAGGCGGIPGILGDLGCGVAVFGWFHPKGRCFVGFLIRIFSW